MIFKLQQKKRSLENKHYMFYLLSPLSLRWSKLSLFIIGNRSPFTSRKGPNGKPYELPQPNTDISFVSSGRPSIDRMNPLFDSFETSSTPRLSNFSNFSDLDQGFESYAGRSVDGRISVDARRSVDGRKSMDTATEISYASIDSDQNLSLSPPRVRNPFFFAKLLSRSSNYYNFK